MTEKAHPRETDLSSRCRGLTVWPNSVGRLILTYSCCPRDRSRASLVRKIKIMSCLRMAKSRSAPLLAFVCCRAVYNWLFYPRYVQKILFGYLNTSRVVTVLTVTSLCATSFTLRPGHVQLCLAKNTHNFISPRYNVYPVHADRGNRSRCLCYCIVQIAFATISTCETQDPFQNILSSSRLLCFLLGLHKKRICGISKVTL